MSTDYMLLDKQGLTIWLDEHSNVFDLAIDVEGAAYLSATDEESGKSAVVREVSTAAPTLTPDDVISMAVQCLKVASYWMDPDEFQAACRKHFGAETGSLGPMAQAFSKL